MHLPGLPGDYKWDQDDRRPDRYYLVRILDGGKRRKVIGSVVRHARGRWGCFLADGVRIPGRARNQEKAKARVEEVLKPD